ncbi:uncharacterized protein PSANT_00184 [Moesziomyces antarcticus]|uniref:Uncharacterized protein n=1 Tax=Pseudozyma antarctica TaxID=84753 RepID=A0A5C3FG49_PSEA2|nr:uncharacterized protein PSANT_00184 [Moesziomyces antarcticus]
MIEAREACRACRTGSRTTVLLAAALRRLAQRLRSRSHSASVKTQAPVFSQPNVDGTARRLQKMCGTRRKKVPNYDSRSSAPDHHTANAAAMVTVLPPCVRRTLRVCNRTEPCTAIERCRVHSPRIRARVGRIGALEIDEAALPDPSSEDFFFFRQTRRNWARALGIFRLERVARSEHAEYSTLLSLGVLLLLILHPLRSTSPTETSLPATPLSRAEQLLIHAKSICEGLGSNEA